MKFGKAILLEARLNNGNRRTYLDYKTLKKQIKRINQHRNCRTPAAISEANARFETILRGELEGINQCYQKHVTELQELRNELHHRIRSGALDVQYDPDASEIISFDDLQEYLHAKAGTGALFEICVVLGTLSVLCKRLRRYVLWNAMGVVKILKKRRKYDPKLDRFSQITHPGPLLITQEWYTSPTLSGIASFTENTTNEMLLALTGNVPPEAEFRCPICLEMIVDPVAIRTCGHRFCAPCLVSAFDRYSESNTSKLLVIEETALDKTSTDTHPCENLEDWTLERCPVCRTVFILDTNSLEIDSVLDRFLQRNFHHADQTSTPAPPPMEPHPCKVCPVRAEEDAFTTGRQVASSVLRSLFDEPGVGVQ
eukprot:GHVO01067461.1.p1 GENE.GHVO01067461.1~~GHVO01067461.1.p1  ORF type:complete len:369 (+),score=64.06 GHVO01067461.1:62-1168(+)